MFVCKGERMNVTDLEMTQNLKNFRYPLNVDIFRSISGTSEHFR